MQRRVSVNESNPAADGTSPRTRYRATRVFVAVLALVVVAGAAGAAIYFTSRSQPDRSRGSAVSLSASQRNVKSCVVSIGATAGEAINDLEHFDESAMSSVMAGFSVSHGAGEYAVLQSVVSDVSQNLNAPWATSWQSAVNHELPTIESYCNKRYPPTSTSTSTSTTSATTTTLAPWCVTMMAKTFIQAQSVKVNADGTATVLGDSLAVQCAPGTPDDVQFNVPPGGGSSDTIHLVAGATLTGINMSALSTPLKLKLSGLAHYLAQDTDGNFFQVVGPLNAATKLIGQYHP